MLFKVIVLVCSVGLQPKDCDRSNAADVWVAPEPVRSEVQCGLEAQVTAANMAHLLDAETHYVKTLCRRVTSNGQVVG